MRDKLSFWHLGIIYAGCFLGAGYMSGQELWQFFGVFGDDWVKGLLLALGTIFIFGSLLLWLLAKTKPKETADLLFQGGHKFWRNGINLMMSVFLYAVIIIMAAGVGALAFQLWHISSGVVSTIFCLLLAAISLSGTRGLAAGFSFVVPFLIVMTVCISVKIMLTAPTFDLTKITNVNHFLPTWYLSAIVFAAHNIFGAVGMLLPFAAKINAKKAISAAAVSVNILGIIAFLVLISLRRFSLAVQKPLPMLYLASYLGDVWGLGYALLLFLTMSASALAAMVALNEKIVDKWQLKKTNAALILAIAAAIGALGGFADLISIVYTICGYFGILVLIGIMLRFWRLKRDR